MKNILTMAVTKLVIITLLCSFTVQASAQGSVSATYSIGDIPTSFNGFDGSCNGNNIMLQVTLPVGDSYTITGIDISYSMTALAGGEMAQQRSQVYCVNTNKLEATVYAGSGNSVGTVNYNRANVDIANGVYPGNTVLSFEMHAWRTVESTPGCNALTNRVNAGSWTITVFYGQAMNIPKVGINTNQPAATLDVNGKIKVGDDITAAQAGMIRWNSSKNDFEGFNGTRWVSLTEKGQNGGWGVTTTTEMSLVKEQAGEANAAYGYSVSIAGDYAIVGSPYKRINANTQQGAAYIFTRLGSQWIQLAPILTASDGSALDQFGCSVAIHGNYAIVGALNKQIGGNASQGKAYIFLRNGDTWTQQAILTANDGAAGDAFGCSVSISGDYVIVGGKEKTISGNTRQGAAYIFSRNNTLWTQQPTLVDATGAANDAFGTAVSIAGNYALVAAPLKNVGASPDQGGAYLYRRSGTEWTQPTLLTASDGMAYDFFGTSVSISESYAVIGATGKLVNAIPTGGAYIFARTGDTWNQQAILTAEDDISALHFGESVSISGDNIVVGASESTYGSGGQSWASLKSRAFVFNRSGNNWNRVATLSSSDGVVDDKFAYSVSIAGNFIIVGAPFKTVNANLNQGQAYFFKQ